MSLRDKIVDKAHYIRTKAGDSAAARRRLHIANLLGSEEAAEEIALCYEDEGRWEKAFKWHIKGLENEDKDSLLALAHCYLEGKGTRKSLPDYIDCLKDAVEDGNVNAMIELGECYEVGRGVRANENKAKELYEKAAEKGSKKAKTALEELISGKARREADQEPVVPEKTAPDAAALRWYKKAVLDENPDAQAKLGIWTLLGMGVPQDVTMGKNLLTEAAAGGSKEARAILKDMSSDTAQGMEAATQYALGELYSEGKYCEPDEAKAFAAYKSAAKAGHIKAMYELGKCYEEGKGTKADIAQAKTWNDKAYATGLKDAEKAKDRIDAAAWAAEEEAKEKARKAAEEVKAKAKKAAEDIKETTKKAAAKTAEGAKKAAAKTAEGAKKAAAKTAEATKKAAETVKKAAKSAASKTKKQ